MLFSAIKSNAKVNFRLTAMLLFYILHVFHKNISTNLHFIPRSITTHHFYT